MPVNTIQVQKLLGKHTFQQLRVTVNELIDVVNGLPSTVRGDITRQGGVIDGNSSGIIPTFDPGALYILSTAGLGVGSFLGANDPNINGHIHVYNNSGNAKLNLSQNTASGISYVSFQASNTASYPQANNFGFLSVTSNTTSRFGMITLGTAYTDYEIDHIYASESWGWGNTVDTSSATRFTLTSGENSAVDDSGEISGIAPHGGPTAHLAAQLRIDRAVNHDPQTSNTAPLLSVRGYTDAYGGVGVNDTPPVRILIGDRTLTAARKANTYAALDFAANGADTTTEDSVGARISAEINREDDDNLARSVSSSLEFSVRSGAGLLEKVMKVIPGGDITGTAAQGAVLISNTHYLDLSTSRGAAPNWTILDGNMQWSQLLIQHTFETGSNYGGLMIRGDDTPGGEKTRSRPVFKMENPQATYTAGRKFAWDVYDTNSGQSRVRLTQFIDDSWTGQANNIFSIAPTDATTYFIFGSANAGASAGQGASSGTTFLMDGGYSTGEGAEIWMGSNRARFYEDPTGRPDTWIIDNNASTQFRIFPRNSLGYDGDTNYKTFTNAGLFAYKSSSANTYWGFGTNVPQYAIHVDREREDATVWVESEYGATAPKDDTRARVIVTGAGNDFAVTQAINPNRTYPTGGFANLKDGKVPFISYQTNLAAGSIGTSARYIHNQNWNVNGIGTGISFRIDAQQGTGDGNAVTDHNDGWAYDMGYIGVRTGEGGALPGFGARSFLIGNTQDNRTGFGSLTISLRDRARYNASKQILHVTAEGHLGLGNPAFGATGGNQNKDSISIINPSWSLDITKHRQPGDTTANTMIAMSLHDVGHSNGNAGNRTWLFGINNDFKGVGKSTDPFVFTGIQGRTLGNPLGTHTQKTTNMQDGILAMEMRDDKMHMQIFQIGLRPEHNTLTVYTPANTTSTNWGGSYAGRVGIGNTFPGYTLTVNGYNADSSGVAVYGAEAGVRLIDPSPTHAAYTWSSADGDEALTDPGGAAGGSVVPERTYHIGSRHGSLSIAQNLGPNDTNIHNTSKNITVSVLANTSLYSPTSSHASLDKRIYIPENLGEDWYSGGSVGINANSHPLAAGLYVTDVPAGDRDGRRRIFTQKAVIQLGATAASDENYGHYPTNVVLGLRPIPNANGAFKPISVVAGSTSNLSNQSSVGNGNIMKRTEGLRRFSEGWIDGAGTGPSAATLSNWNNLGWFDGISVDNSFAIPAPGIGSEFFGTSAMADDTFMGQQSMKVWWERRPQRDNDKANYQNQEYTESHLFGSSNNHVMTIHANTTYQGVHVEKGGIYANNSVIAWARLLPRGINQNPIVAADTTETGYASPPTFAWDGHNIQSVTKVGIGRFQIQLPAGFQNGNNYSLIVTGTSNLYLAGLFEQDLNDGAVSAGELDTVLTRRRQFEASGTGTSPGQIIGLQGSGSTNDGLVDYGALSTHHVRVANSTYIQIESRTPITDWYRAEGSGKVTRNSSSTALIDEDEVYVVVIGAVDPAKFRG